MAREISAVILHPVNTVRLWSAVVLVAAVAACEPPTTYDRGIGMSFQPSAKADGQARLVGSAIELKQESDQKIIKDAGGIFLGELALTAEKTTSYYGAGTTGGASALSGRVSLEVASHGGTHFYITKIDTAPTTFVLGAPRGQHSGQRTTARYNIYRVEPSEWPKLDKPWQPELLPGAAVETGVVVVNGGGI